MSRGIFLIQNDGRLLQMNEEVYDSERLLQELLARYPDLLAGNQINQSVPRRWLLIRREASVPLDGGAAGRGFVDHLFLDQDAVPTFVEVKRSSDTRIRREVVGQMLDYAANAVLHWPIDHLRSEYEVNCRARGLDPDDELINFLEPGMEPAVFWHQAKTNLQAGRLRMLFVADEIPPELRRIVEFLNEQMDPAEVLAVEIKQYAGEGLRTLVPSVVGQTEEAKQRKAGSTASGQQWDEERFFRELLARHGEAEVATAQRILEWARPRTTRVWWGKGQRSGSFVPILNHKGTDYQLFAVYTYGAVELYFQWYKTREPFLSEDSRRELLQKFNQISGVEIPEDAIGRRPSIPLAALASEERTRQFLGIFEWFLQRVRSV